MIPILALGEFDGSPAAFVRALRAAFVEFGFVGIRDHGVDAAVVERAFATARAFFALPDRVKRRYELADGAGQRGYTRAGREKAKDQQRPDLKEFWHVGREAAAGDRLAFALRPNLWPAEVSGFEAAQRALYTTLEQVGARLLEAVALGLGQPREFFARRIDRGNSILRAIHYPPLPAAQGSSAAAMDGAVRAAAHEDINLITLLVGSHEPGLEIRARSGEWIPVTMLEGTLVCNVGDMLQRLTNDRLPSTTHRVVNPPPPWDARSRYSIPFFLHFNPDVLIETLPACITPDRPDRYVTPVTAHDYLEERLREIGLL